ncbi:DUF2963 domain-containing protein [Candidatus Phytoplasma solani]|uniref:DUF2963 domain-containing protein n=1 Tax=Candidatus Phytoplasma solani TaxID=69896 RepID=UPI0032DAB1EA
MNIIKETTNEYGRRVIQETNEKNQLIKKTTFRPNGTTIDSITEYNPQTGAKTKKVTWYSFNDKIYFIEEFNPQTGAKTKATWCHKGPSKTKVDYIIHRLSL